MFEKLGEAMQKIVSIEENYEGRVQLDTWQIELIGAHLPLQTIKVPSVWVKIVLPETPAACNDLDPNEGPRG